VDHDGDRMRTATLGEPKIAELRQLTAVVEPLGGRLEGLPHDHVVVVCAWIIGRQEWTSSPEIGDVLQLACHDLGRFVAVATVGTRPRLLGLHG